MMEGCDWLGRKYWWRSSYILGQILRAKSYYILGWKEYFFCDLLTGFALNNVLSSDSFYHFVMLDGYAMDYSLRFEVCVGFKFSWFHSFH